MADNYNPADNLSEEARSKGGSESGGNFKHNRARAKKAGKRGGEK